MVSDVRDQNDDRVSKNDNSSHVGSIETKGLIAKHEKYGTLSIDVTVVTQVVDGSSLITKLITVLLD